MRSEENAGIVRGLANPYLQALVVAQVPVDQIILQAESMGFPPDGMLRVAEALVPPGPSGSSMAAVLLLLGTTRHWRPFVPWALVFGLRFLEPLLHPCCSEFDPLARLLDGDRWDLLASDALERLGYPLHPRIRGSGETAGPTVLPWLEKDLGLVLDGLELTRFESRAQAWSQVLVDSLVLCDGAGPLALGHAGGDPWSATTRSTRLHRVRRLRTLEGLQHVASLVATDCPSLESLDCTPPIAVLRGCPSLRWIRSNSRSRLLHLEDCRRLRSIGAEKVWDQALNEKVAPSHQTLVLSRCPALRDLPGRMDVTGHMLLRRIGPIHSWPSDFRVGGDLRLKDCPDIEELPALEVGGSLRVEGESGLRRLEAGAVIGRHLDLRACSRLEGVPRGVRVGGAMYLPAHLHRQGPAFEAQEPVLEVPVDHYPILRTLLLGLSFQGLSRPAERLALRERAETALESLRGEVLANPRVEVELLWTASEVWRDLSEELWAEEHAWSCDRNESDDDLPLAWFRGLLLSA